MSDNNLQILYTQSVSGTNKTLQNFDFLAQSLDQMLAQQDCDRLILCSLLQQYAQARSYQPLNPPISQVGDITL